MSIPSTINQCKAIKLNGSPCHQKVFFNILNNGYCKYHLPKYQEILPEPTQINQVPPTQEMQQTMHQETHAMSQLQPEHMHEPISRNNHSSDSICRTATDPGSLQENIILREHNLCLQTQIKSDKELSTRILAEKDTIHQQMLQSLATEYQEKDTIHQQRLQSLETEYQEKNQLSLCWRILIAGAQQEILELKNLHSTDIREIENAHQQDQQILIDTNTVLQMKYDALLSPFLLIYIIFMTLIALSIIWTMQYYSDIFVSVQEVKNYFLQYTIVAAGKCLYSNSSSLTLV